MRLTTRDVARMRTLRYQDGLSCTRVAEIIGCAPKTVQRYAPGKPGKVPVEPLQRLFTEAQARGLTASDVARQLGWSASGSADCSRVRRSLGLLNEGRVYPPTGRRYRRRLIDAEIAGQLAEAMGYEAWEATG